MSTGLNIAALAKRTGVAPDTLRKWEQRYRILWPTRTNGGQRRYSEHDVDRVEWLKARLAEGYRIGEAADLLGSESRETATSPQQLARLVFEAVVRSDSSAVSRLLDHAFALDLATACTEVVQPLLVAVGEAWHTGGMTIGQEHLVTGGVRARLERKLAEGRPAVHGHAVLACGPGERHELGLLMLAVMLRADGWNAAYLGADTPVADALALAGDAAASLLCFSVATPSAADALEASLRLAEPPRGVQILVGGRAANAPLAERVGARYLAGDLTEVIGSLHGHAPVAATA